MKCLVAPERECESHVTCRAFDCCSQTGAAPPRPDFINGMPAAEHLEMRERWHRRDDLVHPFTD